eukprot:scaffold8189_cov73-Cylindrotheca_fusiformis.AAC.1
MGSFARFAFVDHILPIIFSSAKTDPDQQQRYSKQRTEITVSMDGEEDGFGNHGFEMMGMMNSLKTGDVYTDMILAMCVPFILRGLFSWVGKLEDIPN